MIALDLLALVLVLQALFVLHAALGRDDVVRSAGGMAWSLALVAASLAGAFALHVLALA